MSTEAVWGCAKHALMGRTCCQDTEVLLTEGDKARIAASVAPGTEFWERTWPGGSSYVDDGSDPTWSLAFHIDGSRPTLRHRPGGDCVFLGGTGCTLATEVRPLVCRLHPHTYDETGITGVFSKECPVDVVPEGKTLADVVEMDREQAERWRRQLYSEIREDPRR
jgi:Fe-S-cluster containining protein